MGEHESDENRRWECAILKDWKKIEYFSLNYIIVDNTTKNECEVKKTMKIWVRNKIVSNIDEGKKSWSL